MSGVRELSDDVILERVLGCRLPPPKEGRLDRLRKRLKGLADPLFAYVFVNAALALILGFAGLDRGFIAQFTARLQSPLVLAVLAASYALTVMASLKPEQGDKPSDTYALLLGIAIFLAFLALGARFLLFALDAYVVGLSPLTLAPMLPLMLPIGVAYFLASAYGFSASGIAAAAAVAVAMYALPYAALLKVDRILAERKRRAEERKAREYRDRLIYKNARSTSDYVDILTKSRNREQTLKNLSHDLKVAYRYGDLERAGAIPSAVRYVEMHEAIGVKAYPEYADWWKGLKGKGQGGGAQPTGGQRADRGLLEELKSLRIFEGVVGLDEIKREIVWRFLLPLFFPGEAEGVKPAGGVLIYGPTGTGKTEVMRALLDACKRLGIQVVECKPSDVLSKYAGESEKRISELFEKAREKPTVIFIDEADGLLGERSDGEPSWSKTVLKEFLQQMDGLKENQRVLVIACTNAPWSIAEPALRPGRLGSHFYAPPPNEAERMQLFRMFLSRMRVEGEVNYARLAELTKPSQRGYYCGADIRAICDRAYVKALQAGRKAVTMADLEAAAAATQPSISASTVQMFERFAQRYTPLNTPPSGMSEYVR